MSRLQQRIAAFEKAASDAIDPAVMSSKVSEKSDRKKYDFASGLRRDLEETRAALRACCRDEPRPVGHGLRGRGDSGNGRSRLSGPPSVVRTGPTARGLGMGEVQRASSSPLPSPPAGPPWCTFGALFERTGGKIANLNRVLQNLRDNSEVEFRPECFFAGRDDDERIALLDGFWAGRDGSGAYDVDSTNVFRPWNDAATFDVPHEERKGRSYVREDLATRDVRVCAACSELVSDGERMTVRAAVYHLRCLKCSSCGARLRDKKDYVTFDGRLCCGADCVGRYDGAHVRQQRG